MPLEPRPGAKVVPTSSLRVKSRSAEGTRKGPAFWSRSSPHLHRELPRTPNPPSWGLQDRLPGPPDILGLSSWWQISALFLVAASLALFSTLMVLIYSYTREAAVIPALFQKLHRSETRLKEVVRQQAAGRTLACKSCKDHWMQWGDNCYLHTTQALSWKKCLARCKSLGSSLLMVHTEAEMQFLLMQTEHWFLMYNKRLRSGSYWIGLIYNTTERLWQWADGAHLHIHPSTALSHGSSPVDVCIIFSKGFSYIYECTSEHQCLCKRPAE